MTVTVANSQMKSLEHYESVFWNTTKLLHTSMPPTSSTTPIATQYQHNRYWLVPRIGYSLAMLGHQPGRPKARQMISACSVALLFYCLLPSRHPVVASKVSQKPKQFADIIYRFSPQKRSKLENFAQITISPPDSWPVCFTVGAQRHFRGLAP